MHAASSGLAFSKPTSYSSPLSQVQVADCSFSLPSMSN